MLFRSTNTAKWNFRQVCPFPFIIDLIPDETSGSGEAAIHEYYSNAVAKPDYKEFDIAYQDMLAKFESFFAAYPSVGIHYQEMARKAAWLIWSTRLGPRGGLKNTLVYMHKLFMSRAFGWQQCFHAMAMENNVREAWRLLLAMFEYQNEYGGIPDNVSDMNQ